MANLTEKQGPGQPDQTPSRPHASSDCKACNNHSCDAQYLRPDESPAEFEERRSLQNRLCRIKHKIVVLSGKGGVGKSTVAVNLAISLSANGRRVGLLDIDIHGPSIPTMLHLDTAEIISRNNGMEPADVDGLKVMSIGFLLQHPDDAIIWRGPMKAGVIKQFISQVNWDDLDYLIIDSPPGTGDEPLTLCQVIPDLDGAIIVTTPQEVAAVDVRKSISFCRKLKLPVIGVIENMSGFVCPKCGEITNIFQTGGGERIAESYQVPFLGHIPIDPSIGIACDQGTPFVDRFKNSPTAHAFQQAVTRILS